MSEPFRRSPTGIVVDLHWSLRRWLAESAVAVAQDALRIGDPVHRRVLGPIDLTADHDDAVVELQRQFVVEGSLGVLVETSGSKEISEEQAEEWIRALQLLLAATAARLAVVDEDDVAGLDQESTSVITTLQALISLMIDALDS